MSHISRGKITIKNLLNICQILGRNVIITCLIAIDSAAISVDNNSYVFRTLHATFNFIANHACFDELGQNGQGIHILGAEQILACVLALQHVLALSIQKLIGQTAGLRATATVTTASANKATHEALTAIAYAQSTVDKGFDFRTTTAGSFDFL